MNRLRLDIGDRVGSRELADTGLARAKRREWNHEVSHWYSILGRLVLAERGDAKEMISHIRDWTARTGDVPLIIEGHLLSVKNYLLLEDLPAALAEAESGLLLARNCGFRIKEIEILIATAWVHLAWPNATEALAASRQALALATSSACNYVWGESDAAQVWGLAFVASGREEQARSALESALKTRQRIGHPGVAETIRALSGLGKQ
jgi:tetratricopeptide (TPR) repeat protein